MNFDRDFPKNNGEMKSTHSVPPQSTASLKSGAKNPSEQNESLTSTT